MERRSNGEVGRKGEGRSWLYEWSPRRKRLSPSPSHTLKPKKALLEIPSSHCRYPVPGTGELVGGPEGQECVSFSKPGLLGKLGAVGRRGHS